MRPPGRTAPAPGLYLVYMANNCPFRGVAYGALKLTGLPALRYLTFRAFENVFSEWQRESCAFINKFLNCDYAYHWGLFAHQRISIEKPLRQ